MIEIKQNLKQKKKFSIFSYGFRPFFLGAGIYAILPIIPWLFYLSGYFSPHIPLQIWHAHEMLFGFVAAGISGFLLTSIPKWTNTPPLTGRGLRKFFYFWLSGRVAFWLFLLFENPIFGYFLFLDLLLPAVQTIRIARIFINTNSKKNYVFIGILAGLTIANLLVILDLNNITEATAQITVILAPNIIMLAIAVIGGRVTPNFTRSYLKQKGINGEVRTFILLEIMAIGVLIIHAIINVFMPYSFVTPVLAVFASMLHLLRFSQWQTIKILKNPMLWIFHLGYLWLIIALILKGMEAWFELPYHIYLHAFTVGAVGSYLLGIMSRAALGHTGRVLSVGPNMIVAYAFISIAAIIRVLTSFYSNFFLPGVILTTILWIFAFSTYLWIYVPILTSPRIDGKPG